LPVFITAIAAFCQVKSGLLFITGLKQFFLAVVAARSSSQQEICEQF
jgi:hypothetical protein